MASASARHILVEDKEVCQQLKEKIANGETTFEEAAAAYSQCPSGNEGGNLGTFQKGMMVPEFDRVVFNDALNVVHGPIETQFGWHLLETTSRED
jgi:peptidyl-prolyl cis-trans isomerase C